MESTYSVGDPLKQLDPRLHCSSACGSLLDPTGTRNLEGLSPVARHLSNGGVLPLHS